MWDQKGENCDNQLWYANPIHGTICSKSSDLCMEIGLYSILGLMDNM